jgi:hypothetical protein
MELNAPGRVMYVPKLAIAGLQQSRNAAKASLDLSVTADPMEG